MVSSLVLLGGACYKAADTNVNVAGNANVVELNTNFAINTNVEVNSNVEVNTNSVSNTNSVVNTNISTVDNSDWLTYTNEEYGFSFRYPKEWILTERNTILEGPDKYLNIGVSTGGHYPSLGIATTQRPIEEIVQEVYEFDAELSPVVSDEMITINNTEVRRIVKKGIDFPVTTYLLSLQNKVVLMFDSTKLYDEVVYTLVVK